MMNRFQSAALALITLIACSQGLATSASESTTADHQPVLAQSQSVALMTGEFVTAEQPTTGIARIVTENGQQYLELDSKFSTSDQGPDLHVILDTNAEPPASYAESEAGRYINLGALQEFSGTQRYPIPDVVDPTAFNSVVIWCRMANATFGYAPLSSDAISTK